jgi:hypothetical protein
MNVGKSVRKSIDEWSSGDFDSAMLHACNAVDGTARAVHPKLANKLRFTRLLRDNYFILGRMGVPKMTAWFVPLDEWVFVARARNMQWLSEMEGQATLPFQA